MDPLYLHIGLPKAASSTIQQYLIGRSDILFLDHWKAARAFTSISEMRFDQIAAHRLIEEGVETAHKQGKKAFLSNERFYGSFLAGCFDLVEVADRFRRSWPFIRIIIVLREQREMLKSMYKWYLLMGGTKRLKDFVRDDWDIRWPMFTLDILKYDGPISLYYSMFGRENVHVAFFEELVRDSPNFWESLCKFMDIEPPPKDEVLVPKNVSFPDGLAESKRLSNFLSPERPSEPYSHRLVPENPNILQTKLLSYPTFFILKGLAALGVRPLHLDLDTEVSTICENRFDESNYRLSELLNRDLVNLGYSI